ncbi:MAG TPA: 30S ribosome-binding factor RbfA [Gammaproteobacteria bacterium]|nr:30S ribosome-binding factor RbfA [Gammaproteobacteria bacterium]
MKRGYERSTRVSDLIRKALANILLQEMHDPQFRFVTITGVDVSRDLSYAKVYVSTLQDEKSEIKQLMVDLNNSTKSIRYHLAKAVKLRIVPELKFVYDETAANGFRISQLIDSAVKNIKDE